MTDINTFLYDYQVNTYNNQIHLFGYIQSDQQFKKTIIKLVDFDIFLNIAIDYEFFTDHNQMISWLKQLKETNTQKFPEQVYDLITNVSLFNGQTFKGFYNNYDKPSHIRVKFNSFENYQHFKKILSVFNKEFRRYVTDSDRYINNLFRNFGEELKQFKKNESEFSRYLRQQHPKEYQQYNDDSQKYIETLGNNASEESKQDKQFGIANSKTIMNLYNHIISKKVIHTVPKDQSDYSSQHIQEDNKTQSKDLIDKYPFRMSEDDPSQKYIYKLQRHHKFLLSDWNTIIFQQLQYEEDQDRYYGICSVNNIKEIGENNLPNPLSILSWDIEVSSLSGKFDQNAKTDDNVIICIGGSFGKFTDAEDQIKHFCICYIPCKGIKEIPINIIQVSNEQEMIIEFGRLIRTYDPTFITGFNDSSYDIPFLKDKLEWHNSKSDSKNVIKQLIEENFKCYYKFTNQEDKKKQIQTIYIQPTEKTLFNQAQIKIAANTYKSGYSLNIPGIICVDTRTYLMKTQKIEKKSLNEYLKANNLPLKLEVSFKDMNTSFRNILSDVSSYTQLDSLNNGDLQDPKVLDLLVMNKIMEYCAYDADACRLLWNKRLVIQQASQLSNLSYTPIRCVFDNADGIKVRNMVASFAFNSNYSVPMDSQTSSDVRWRDTQLLDKYEKYPGAYVPEPKKGVNITPVAALDFASLYPSIIMAHNLSPENVFDPLQCREFLNQVNDNTEPLVNINSLSGESDFNICNYEANLLNVRSKSSIETSQVCINFAKGDMSEQLRGFVLSRTERVGIYPTILQYLFNLRKQVRQRIAELEEQQESKDQQFQIALLNAKQLAIKVFMNTFYGETGNQNSPLFDVIISGGTTSFGQRYIKEVHQRIKQKDCEIVYGDTDSVYFRPRASLFHNKSSIQQILNESFTIVSTIRDEINDHIGQKTFGFLKMEFEELLCPSLFTGKKKYCGVIYKQESNSVTSQFKSFVDISKKDTVLLKGIDFIKSQYPPLIKKYGNRVIQDIMNHFNNQYSLIFDPEQNNELKVADIFQDNYRFTKLNIQLQQIVLKTFQELSIELQTISCDQYDQLSSRKKIRDVKSGEMQQFQQRMSIYQEFKKCSESNQLQSFIMKYEEDQLKTMINTDELQQLNIPIPEQGEFLDIIYIAQNSDKKLKTSQKMHLLQYAKQKNLKLDIGEYMKMFQTSAIRLIISSYYDETSTFIDEDTEEYKQLEKEAVIKAKLLFSSGFVIQQKQVQGINDVIINQQILKINTSIEKYRKQLGQGKIDFSRINIIPCQELKDLFMTYMSHDSYKEYKYLFQLWCNTDSFIKKIQVLPDKIRDTEMYRIWCLNYLDQSMIQDLIQILVVISFVQQHKFTKKSVQQTLTNLLSTYKTNL